MFDVNLLVYIFSFLLIMSSFTVVIAWHPIFSLLSLVACFIFSAFLLFLLECEFLGLLFSVALSLLFFSAAFYSQLCTKTFFCVGSVLWVTHLFKLRRKTQSNCMLRFNKSR